MNESSTVTIETENLPNYLRTLGTQCRFISLMTEVEVEMRKTGNPFVGTVKRSRRNGLINVNFSQGVRRRMMEKGVDPVNHVPGKTWYVHEQTEDGKPLPLCQSKKDNALKFLQYYPHRSFDTEYWLNGEKLSPMEVDIMKTFIPNKAGNEYKPIVIVLGMKSIRWIKFRKITMVSGE